MEVAGGSRSWSCFASVGDGGRGRRSVLTCPHRIQTRSSMLHVIQAPNQDAHSKTISTRSRSATGSWKRHKRTHSAACSVATQLSSYQRPSHLILAQFGNRFLHIGVAHGRSHSQLVDRQVNVYPYLSLSFALAQLKNKTMVSPLESPWARACNRTTDPLENKLRKALWHWKTQQNLVWRSTWEWKVATRSEQVCFC